jgi:hypothetical protein
MINFKDRQDMLPSLITVSSVVVLAGTLGFILYANANPPSSRAAVAAARLERKEIAKRIDEAQAKLALTRAVVSATTWNGKPQDIQTEVLKRVRALAAQRGVKINTVRPQRSSTIDLLTALPSLITVEGSYPSVLAFERDLEAPANRLAVSVVQVTGVDTNSDLVTASIGVTAFMNPNDPTIVSDKEKTTRA